MADVAENKPTEQVADQAPAAPATEAAAEKPATTEAEKPTEATDNAAEKPATTTPTEAETPTAASDKPAEATTPPPTEEKPAEQNNDRKRRGSFQDRRGGDNKRGRGRGGARGGFKERQNKSRFETLPESDDAGEIRRQVEFYFSDSNLPIDAYLLKLSGGKENKAVPLKTIHDFKRMRHFQPYSAVRDAVAASKFLNLSEDDQITRKVALSEKFGEDAEENKKIASTANMARSIYAKGFGPEDEKTQLDIE